MAFPHDSIDAHVNIFNARMFLLLITVMSTFMSTAAFLMLNSPKDIVVRNHHTKLSALRPWRLNELALEEKLNSENVFLNSTKKTLADASVDQNFVATEEESDDDDDSQYGNRICRIVAKADGKLPSMIPPSLASTNYGFLLEKVDAICHAKAHAETRSLGYLQSKNEYSRVRKKELDTQFFSNNMDEEVKTTQILRKSLEDAGFEMSSQRDLDLCEALNVGYLLRLSIKPEINGFDPNLGRSFFPELYHSLDSNGIEDTSTKEKSKKFSPDEPDESSPLLFNGRILIFRRGYSQEITRGRLSMAKLDYLQANLVQRTASSFGKWLTNKEKEIEKSIRKSKQAALEKTMESIPAKYNLTDTLTKYVQEPMLTDTNVTGNKVSKLSKAFADIRGVNFAAATDLDDALNPFIVCEIENGDSDTKDFSYLLNDDDVSEKPSLNRLLKRVSISNLVDLFSKGGRRRLLKSLVSESKLVEPTYEEVVVLWRPLPEKKLKKPKLLPPKFLYDIGEIFGFDDRMPNRTDTEQKPLKGPIQIRSFVDVPMANLQAVFPKTRLIFRSADAVLFDSISIISFLAVLASQQFDSPKLDIIAIISVSLWILRTFFRYSNKLARYDLLVNKFLTSKISQRDNGAMKYIVNEAAQQRAIRASLVYFWLVRLVETSDIPVNETLDSNDENWIDSNGCMSVQFISNECEIAVNRLLETNTAIRIDHESALNDLEGLGLVRFTEDRKKLEVITDQTNAKKKLEDVWNNIFDESK